MSDLAFRRETARPGVPPAGSAVRTRTRSTTSRNSMIGMLRSDDGCDLQQCFALRAEAVDARGDHRLHRLRNLDFADFAGQFITAGTQRAAPRFPPSVLTVSSMNSGVPSVRSTMRARNSALAAVAEQGPHQIVGRIGFERIEIDGGEEVLASHLRSYSGRHVTSHQQAAGPHGFDQAVDHVSRLDVGPLDVLEPEQKRTDFRRSEGKGPSRVDAHSLPAHCGVERRPVGILDRKVEQRLQGRNIDRRACRQCGESLVQAARSLRREKPARGSRTMNAAGWRWPDRACRVVCGGGGLEHRPTGQLRGLEKFVDQPGFSGARPGL